MGGLDGLGPRLLWPPVRRTRIRVSPSVGVVAVALAEWVGCVRARLVRWSVGATHARSRVASYGRCRCCICCVRGFLIGVAGAYLV